MLLRKIACSLNTHFNFNCIHRLPRTLYQVSTVRRTLSIDKITFSINIFYMFRQRWATFKEYIYSM
jgi:hypothetical protein